MVFYEVPKPVEMVHSWKRIGASNEFEPDFSSDAGKSYMRGVMGIAGAYIAVGILLFIIYSISNCAAVCCYGKPRPKSKENKGGCCAWVFSARIWYFIATLVVCALAAAGLSQVSAFKAATMQTFDAVQDFTGILTTTSETVANGLVPNMNGLTASLTQFKNAAVATGNPALASNLDSVIAASTAASSASMAFSGQINGTTGDIDDQTTGDHSVQNKYLSKVWIAGLACLALFLGFMLLTLFGLLSTKGACVYFGLCQALLVCVVLGVFIFSGIFAAVSIVAADVCVAPSQSINSMLSVVTTDPTVLGTVSYYTTCGNSSAGVVPPSGAYAMVVNGSVGLQTARYALDALEGNATVMAVYGPYVQWSQGNLSAANGTMQTVLDTVGCAPVYGLYQNILDALCTKGGVAVISVWGLGTAVCIFIAILAISAARICCAHPGNVFDDVDAKMGTVYDVHAPGANAATLLPGSHVVVPSGSAASYATGTTVPNWPAK